MEKGAVKKYNEEGGVNREEVANPELDGLELGSKMMSDGGRR
jgi:hypothetical protein